jgi:hypothetical protein
MKDAPMQHEGPPLMGQIFTRALSPLSPYTRIHPHRSVHLVCTQPEHQQVTFLTLT